MLGLGLITSTNARAVPNEDISLIVRTPSQSSSSSVTGPTLLPAVHWDFPVNDIRNLAPGSDTQLYYSTNGISDPRI